VRYLFDTNAWIKDLTASPNAIRLRRPRKHQARQLCSPSVGERPPRRAPRTRASHPLSPVRRTRASGRGGRSHHLERPRSGTRGPRLHRAYDAHHALHPPAGTCGKSTPPPVPPVPAYSLRFPPVRHFSGVFDSRRLHPCSGTSSLTSRQSSELTCTSPPPSAEVSCSSVAIPGASTDSPLVQRSFCPVSPKMSPRVA
jgi:hypothetical protein